MSYLDQNAVATSPAMLVRVAQCAAGQGIPEPDNWTATHRREWAGAPDWGDAWASALASHPPDPEAPDAYDPGSDPAVITDGMILAQVQAMTNLGE